MSISHHVSTRQVLAGIAVPLVITAFFWFTRVNDVSWIALLSSFALCLFAWVSYLRWHARRDTAILFPLVAAMYWLAFVVPLFWGELILAQLGGAWIVSPQALDEAMLMAATGVAAMWIGSRTPLGRRLVSRSTIDVDPRRGSVDYVRVLLILGSILSFRTDLVYIAGEAGRQAILVASSAVPTVACALLFRRILRDEAEGIDKLLVIAFALFRVLSGMSAGWLGASTAVIVIGAIIYIQERRTIPFTLGLIVVTFMMFFQVAKGEFRKTFWAQQSADTSMVERLSFWWDTATGTWGNAMRSDTSQDVRNLATLSLNRATLVTRAAHVLELTPDAVPFQNGRLYSYLAVTFVPRFLWPNKPTINEANRFYQVEYGITEEQNLGNVSISVGSLTEAYINFGWWGVVLIMFGIGLVFAAFERHLLTKDSGEFLMALGVCIIPNFLSIEGQLAVYLSGIVQTMFFVTLVFSPILHLKLRQGKGSGEANARWIVRGTALAPDPVAVRH